MWVWSTGEGTNEKLDVVKLIHDMREERIRDIFGPLAERLDE